MAQIWIELDDNENCGYYPVQVFEARGEPVSGSMVRISELPGRVGPQEIVGWCSDAGGSPCAVTVVIIGDSGAGESRLIRGGDHGLRVRSSGEHGAWSLDDEKQAGEPYVLLDAGAEYSIEV